MCDTGFNKENVLRLEIDSSSAGYTPGEPREVALNQQIEERVSALPNVKAASFSAFTFHEGSWNSKVVVPGMTIDEDINVNHNVVGNGYFATMQIPLLAGRNFSPSDTSTSQHCRNHQRAYRQDSLSPRQPDRASLRHGG